jgi:hypothetical protein
MEDSCVIIDMLHNAMPFELGALSEAEKDAPPTKACEVNDEIIAPMSSGYVK